MTSLNLLPSQPISKTKQLFHHVSFPRDRISSFRLGVVKRISNQTHASMSSITVSEVPVLSCEEVIERLRLVREERKGQQEFPAMYSSVFRGITTDPAVMVIPMDDHMVHRGHGVFDTALLMDGHLYELDQHLDRFLRSASMAKIDPPFDKDTIRSILMETISVSKCKEGSLRYWLSSGHGDFGLTPSGCAQSAFYAIVIKYQHLPNHEGVKVVTSDVPIKPPMFASIKSVNYLPNVLSQIEAEEKGCFTSVWLDSEGFVAEGPNMNVAFVTKEKEFLVPKFDNILSGCTANRVLTLLEEMVKKGEIKSVCVRDVTAEEGKMAVEMMLIGSGVQVRSVIQWDDQVIGNGKEGPVAKALLNLMMEDMKSGPPSVRVPVPYKIG